MKRIEVFIKPHRIYAMTDALLGVGVSGFTTTEVLEFGPIDGAALGHPIGMALRGTPHLKLEVVVHDDLVPRVVKTFLRAVLADATGSSGVLVTPVAAALRIWTGEIDEAAIF